MLMGGDHALGAAGCSAGVEHHRRPLRIDLGRTGRWLTGQTSLAIKDTTLGCKRPNDGGELVVDHSSGRPGIVEDIPSSGAGWVRQRGPPPRRPARSPTARRRSAIRGDHEADPATGEVVAPIEGGQRLRHRTSPVARCTCDPLGVHHRHGSAVGGGTKGSGRPTHVQSASAGGITGSSSEHGDPGRCQRDHGVEHLRRRSSGSAWVLPVPQVA